MREFELIRALSRRVGAIPGVEVGIGDDAAVMAPGRCGLVALDTMVEGLHFRRDYSSAADVGWKLLACNLSDIAAMGGAPGAYFLSLSLGEGADEAWVEGLFAGLEAAAAALAPEPAAVAPAGGDTTGSPGPLVLSLTLTGQAPSRGAVLRGGARAGDEIWLFGRVGLAAAGLEVLRRWPEGSAERAAWPSLVEAHRRPQALCRLGAALGESGLLHAMIDVSDGLLQDLGHILARSGVGARVRLEAVPVSPEAAALAALLGEDARAWALSGGDDYALVATAPASSGEALAALCAAQGVAAARLGEVVAGEGLEALDAQGRAVEASALGRGHEHALGGRG